MHVTYDTITTGLRQLGLDESSSVVVHASLRSFGHVEGGADTVARALTDVCGTVLVLAASGDVTRLPAPPGLVRPHNAFYEADDWTRFDEAVAAAGVFRADLPVDGWLGAVAEALRRRPGSVRSDHPLFSFVAVGEHADDLITAQRTDLPLGPLDTLAALDGQVLLLGVSHTSNTTMHLAEQRLGRSRFFRYAKTAPGVWSEFPDIPGESHRFDDIESELAPLTTEARIGSCRARKVSVNDVLTASDRVVRADPAALLCDDPSCRCGAALQQRLAVLARES